MVTPALVFAVVGALYALHHEVENGRESLPMALLLPGGLLWLQVFR